MINMLKLSIVIELLYNLQNMDFWNRLISKEKLDKLVLFLWTDEQQEFLDRFELTKISKDKFYKESILQNLSFQERENEKRYNYLLDKAQILSTMKNEDRLAILLLTDLDQIQYINLSLSIQKILDWDENDDSWDYEFNIKEYDLLHEKAKSRYWHRSLL